MRLDTPRLLDPDSAITREIAEAFPDADSRAHRVVVCAAEYPSEQFPFRCTRPSTHDGPHVAQDDDGPLAVWPKVGGR